MPLEIIHAPFTDEQVANLNAYQLAGKMHPFACGSGNHSEQEILIADVWGWYCPLCSYTQDWAHKFMAKDMWRE